MNKSLDLKGPVKCLKLCISHQIQNFLRQGGAAPMQTPSGLNDSSYIAVRSQTSSLKLTECSISISISISIWLVHRSLLFTCSYVFTVVLFFSNFFVCYWVTYFAFIHLVFVLCFYMDSTFLFLEKWWLLKELFENKTLAYQSSALKPNYVPQMQTRLTL